MSKGNQRCGNCRFYLHVADSRAKTGLCRINPPQFDAVTREPGNNSVRPDTNGDSWCGQWVADQPDTVDGALLALCTAALKGDMTAARAARDRMDELEGRQ